MDKQDLKMREAGQWWLRLQEDPGSASAAEWMAWAQSDPANLDAFDRVEAAALELKRLDAAQKAELAREFSLPAGGSPRRQVYIAAAASVAVAAVAVAFHFSTRFSPDAVYSTGRALHEDIRLVDGSKVTVGASSSIAVRMREDGRRIRLREGEAYFEVEKDALRPFVVEAGGISVIAVGTAFNVRKTGDSIAVSVTDGRVRAEQRGEQVEAGAGERIVYDPRRRRFEVAQVSTQRALAWRERRLEFVNEALSVVIGNVNRYAGAPIRIADDEAAGLTFTGTVSPDNLSVWLDALPDVLPVRVERAGGSATIHFQTGPAARLVQ